MTPKERVAMQPSQQAIAALREALSGDNVSPIEQAEQEPKYWTYMVNGTWRNIDSVEPPDDAYDEGSLEPLYAAPLAKQDTHATHVVRTKDLTDDEIKAASLQAGMQEHYMGFHSGFLRFARAVIAADREKNK